jgi:hypothetical protein
VRCSLCSVLFAFKPIQGKLPKAGQETKLTDPWKRFILRTVCKTMWEVLDEFGESILDTILNMGEKAEMDQWSVWY